MGLWTLLLLLLAAASETKSVLAVTFPLPDDCPSRCGNIDVRYPFGLEEGCFRPGFKVICRNHSQSPELFLSDNTTRVFNLTTPDFVGYNYRPFFWINPLSQVFNISSDDPSTTREISWTTPGEGTPYAVSDANTVTVVGCGVTAFLIDGRTNISVGNCMTTCTDDMSAINGSCSYRGLGFGCCIIEFRQSIKSVKIQFKKKKKNPSEWNSTVVKILVGVDPYIYGYAAEDTARYEFTWQDLNDIKNISGHNVRGALEWTIPDQDTCESAQKDKANYACLDAHSFCENSTIPGLGYNCYCEGYSMVIEDNPYIPHGCRVHKCKYRICSKLVLGLIIGVSTGMFLLLLTTLIIFIVRRWKKIKEKKMKKKNFNQNHGLLLQQLISSNEDIAKRTKIFSLEEIEKATDNFDTTRILGRGGHGTVYKGILADQRVVAIKKSKIVVKDEIDQFINEVAILSRINHRNIVRLFGCCLETEVSLLVYEFISNGTLHDHLHLRDATTSLSWNDRLRIAIEAASALSYLHSAAFISIFHRDVKSSNILLDDHLIAKMSDFGSSRSIPNDETHIVTIVQGTYGYLDPQYYRTGALTEKSDVYSFGVILLELLTGKKPISTDIMGEERNLTINFLGAINENRHFHLLDARVQVEGTKEELEDVAQLACMCISFESSARPTMKEVEHKLQVLVRKRKQTHDWKQVIGELPILVDGAFLDNSANQSNEDASHNYSIDKYLMSMDFPR